MQKLTGYCMRSAQSELGRPVVWSAKGCIHNIKKSTVKGLSTECSAESYVALLAYPVKNSTV